MPYRRRRSYRSRTARRKVVWVRSYATTAAQISGTDFWSVDLLAPLRMDTPLASARVGTMASQTLPIGTSIARVRILYTVLFQNTTGNIDWEDAVTYGCLVFPWRSDAQAEVIASSSTSTSDRDPHFSAQVSDWMAWGLYSPHVDGPLGHAGVAVASASAIGTLNLDVKSQRRLADIGDSLTFNTRYEGTGAGPFKQRVVASTLLRLP